MLLPEGCIPYAYMTLQGIKRLAGSALPREPQLLSGDAARLFGASNRAVTLIKAESYHGTSTRICTMVKFETHIPNSCFPGPVTSHFELHFRGCPYFSRFIMSRRGTQPEPCGPEPRCHQRHQIQDADIDPWTQIQRFFKMPSQNGLKELNINYGRPVMVLLPLAGLAKIFHWNPIIVLVVNIVAIIFLSEAISISSDELADHLGELQGALLSATFGNTVELTVSQNYCPEFQNDLMLTQSRRAFWLWFMGRSNLHSLSWLAVSYRIFYL
jgi:Ca2+/H+ antiporter